MPHHFQKKGRISRGLHEKVDLLGYRDLGNGTGSFPYDHAYWVTVNIFVEKKASLGLLVPIFWLALKKCFFRYSTGGGGGEGEELQMLIQEAVLFRLKCSH